MTDSREYTSLKLWSWTKPNGGAFAGSNVAVRN